MCLGPRWPLTGPDAASEIGSIEQGDVESMARGKAVILMAAGRGTRMKSKMTKVLHPIAGRPMIHYPVRTAVELGADRIVVVLGYQREDVEAYLRAAFPDAPIETV